MGFFFGVNFLSPALISLLCIGGVAHCYSIATISGKDPTGKYSPQITADVRTKILPKKDPRKISGKSLRTSAIESAQIIGKDPTGKNLRISAKDSSADNHRCTRPVLTDKNHHKSAGKNWVIRRETSLQITAQVRLLVLADENKQKFL